MYRNILHTSVRVNWDCKQRRITFNLRDWDFIGPLRCCGGLTTHVEAWNRVGCCGSDVGPCEDHHVGTLLINTYLGKTNDLYFIYALITIKIRVTVLKVFLIHPLVRGIHNHEVTPWLWGYYWGNIFYFRTELLWLTSWRPSDMHSLMSYMVLTTHFAK